MKRFLSSLLIFGMFGCRLNLPKNNVTELKLFDLLQLLPGTANVISVSDKVNRLDVTWSAAENADGYFVERSDSENGMYIQIAQIGNTISYSDLTAPAKITSWYRIKGLNSVGTGSYGAIGFASKTGVVSFTNDFSNLNGVVSQNGAVLSIVSPSTCSSSGMLPPSGNVMENDSSISATAYAEITVSTKPTFISYYHCRTGTSGYMDFTDSSGYRSISHHTPADNLSNYVDGWSEPGNFWSFYSQAYSGAQWIYTEYRNISWQMKTYDVYSNGVLVKKGASFADVRAKDVVKITMSQAYTYRSSWLGNLVLIE